MSAYLPHMTPMVLSEGGEAMANATTGNHSDFKMINSNAAAIDLGSTMHVAAVNPDMGGEL